MDQFIKRLPAVSKPGAIKNEMAEQCLEMLCQYLIHFSDLFQDIEFADENEFAEWEENLESHMVDLLEGDVEPSSDLGRLPLDALDPEHVRDFLGWFVVRETSDIDLIQGYAAVLQQWIEFIHTQGWWKKNEYIDFVEIMAEVTPAAERVARVARVLFHFVRSGGGIAPRLRGKRFSRFVEGHGRVNTIDDAGITMDFDAQDEIIGPLLLPKVILDLIETGDVFDVELGLRGDTWVMVDIGPVYPACVYVEVEEYQGLEKLS
ncbi:hypothetical protein MMIC_P1781 [Mariprofundus micogutta]|uniref:Uncharacterized protein n=2 Tax=Mariprofundus micogutta TaxID=1921010 RepID=A0A1L8CPH7_9PROT|nr:hypothetical protein MMIC_P1781 [Mariprofundus micogutta]